jgi:pyrroloquinoline quinone biosynthesis protein B
LTRRRESTIVPRVRGAIGALIVAVWLVAGCAPAPEPTSTTAAPATAAAAADTWEIVVLGVAQGAGIPHLGCDQELCRSIREGQRAPERVASLGLVNRARGVSYLFDATPDMVSQLGTLNGGRPPTGIFLTHAHMGHYTGLMFLGRESLDAKAVPVYGTGRMAGYLTNNGPWSQLVTRKNIDLRILTPDTPVGLDDGLSVTPMLVPHRDEFTDTVGYLIERAGRRVLFIPDIDQWSRWDRPIRELVDTVDLAFLDGSFASAEEIPGRTIADIPHPLMPVTRALLGGTRAEVWFIHVNHTNRELRGADVVRDGQRFGL